MKEDMPRFILEKPQKTPVFKRGMNASGVFEDDTHIFKCGLFIIRNDLLYTLNLKPGKQVYGEELRVIDNREYRSFTPKRSKLGAVFKHGLSPKDVLSCRAILYLGAATGTTVSHISDMLPTGKIFSVEIAPRSFRGLLRLAEERKNIFPLLKNASRPETYRYFISSVDMIYQDISQKDQVKIFLRNANMFLRKGKKGYLMLKAHCIDSSRPSEDTFGIVHDQLIEGGLIVEDTIDLFPYQRDHAAFIIKKGR